jgi:hypothetical protein
LVEYASGGSDRERWKKSMEADEVKREESRRRAYR